MPTLDQVVSYCNERVALGAVKDYPGALNGLQVANSGRVTRIGAAVDAGLVPFRAAAAAKIDFLIVHHGLFWDGPAPLTGPAYRKIKTLIDGNCALYSCHLPLDAHEELGNNALLVSELGLTPAGGFLRHEGVDIGRLATGASSRDLLRRRLQRLFPRNVRALEFGSSRPHRIAVLSGSGSSALPYLRDYGVDTLITGELKQSAFNLAQEQKLNLYLCGHYATETFGVKALAADVARNFELEWVFIRTDCPL